MTRPTPAHEPFLSRWSRLKRAHAEDADAAGAVPLVEPPVALPPSAAAPAALATTATATTARAAAGEGAAPALPAIESLTMESDYAQFFQPKVPEVLRRAAVKKLFADPHFNIMDGLDTYIDDYSKPDPIPPEMLARLVQARDIIDHPSDHEAASAGPAPVIAADDTARQPDAPAMTAEQAESDAPGPAQARTTGEERAGVEEQPAAAFNPPPLAELSPDSGTAVARTAAKPAGTAA